MKRGEREEAGQDQASSPARSTRSRAPAQSPASKTTNSLTSKETPVLDEIALQQLRQVVSVNFPSSSALTKKDIRKLDKEPLHLMPCKVHYSGMSPVATFFQPTSVGATPSSTSSPSSSPSSSASPSSSSSSSSSSSNSSSSSSSSSAVSSTEVPSSSTNASNSSSSSNSAATSSTAAHTPAVSSETYTAAFRGRQVTGKRVNLASGTVGLVLSSAAPGAGAGAARTVNAAEYGSRHADSNASANANAGPTSHQRQSPRKAAPTAVSSASSQRGSGGGAPGGVCGAQWTVSGRFNSFFAWSKDAGTRDQDHVLQALAHAVPLAHALHSHQ